MKGRKGGDGHSKGARGSGGDRRPGLIERVFGGDGGAHRAAYRGPARSRSDPTIDARLDGGGQERQHRMEARLLPIGEAPTVPWEPAELNRRSEPVQQRARKKTVRIETRRREPLAVLIGLEGTLQGSAYVICDEQTQFGRETGLQIDDETVSSRQAEIVVLEGVFYLKSLGETNPIKRNGEIVPIETAIELEDGDLLEIGRTTFSFRTARR